MCGELLSARPNSRIQYSASTRNTTPLDYEVLPSPPRTIEVDHSQTRLNRLLQHAETLKREAEARSTSSLTQLKVDTADRVEVYDRIELIWARFDCDPEHFTLRMPSPPHEILATSLAGSIAGGISDIGRDNIDAREFTSQLRPEGSARIIFPYKEKQEKQKKHKDGDSISERVRRQPDGQFRHGRAKFPGVVIEVSYSQDGKQLSSLAKQYINYSDGNIKAVICVDINYGRQESTISLWKARFTSILESDDPDEYLLDYESVIEKEVYCILATGIKRALADLYITAFPNSRWSAVGFPEHIDPAAARLRPRAIVRGRSEYTHTHHFWENLRVCEPCREGAYGQRVQGCWRYPINSTSAKTPAVRYFGRAFAYER